MEGKEFDYINVVPLVDIMLVLLTIVLTTATFVAQGEMPVSLPSAESLKEGRTYQAINITVKRDGTVFLGSKEVSLKELSENLKLIERNTPVNLRIDREAKVQAFVSVMDVLNRNGFRNVNLLVKKYEH